MRAHEASHAAWRQLESEWEETREVWRDSTGDYFAAHFWGSLEAETERLTQELERLRQVLEMAQSAAAG